MSPNCSLVTSGVVFVKLDAGPTAGSRGRSRFGRCGRPIGAAVCSQRYVICRLGLIFDGIFATSDDRVGSIAVDLFVVGFLAIKAPFAVAGYLDDAVVL